MSRAPYYVQTGSMFDNPYGADHEAIAHLAAGLSDEDRAQVIYGKFVELSGMVFTAETVTEMFDYSLPVVRGDTYLDRDRAAQHAVERTVAREAGRELDPYRFAHGVDLARKKDYTVITVLDTHEWPVRLCYWRRLNRVPWASIYAAVGKAMWTFPGEQLIDGTGSGGDVVAEALQNSLYCPVHDVAFDATNLCPEWERGRSQQIACRASPGWIRLNPLVHIMTSGTKVQLINHLQQALSHGYEKAGGEHFGAIRSPPIHHLIEEMSEYAWDDKKLDTDCVMSLALAAKQGIHGIVEDALIGSVHGE